MTNECLLGRNATEKKILRNVWSKGDLCFRSGDIMVISIKKAYNKEFFVNVDGNAGQ